MKKKSTKCSKCGHDTSLGGQAVKAKYGPEYFRELRKKRKVYSLKKTI